MNEFENTNGSSLQEGRVRRVLRTVSRGLRTAGLTAAGLALGGPIGAAVGAGVGVTAHVAGRAMDKDDDDIDEEYNLPDAELLDVLEENGYAPTLRNMNILKEGLANGTYVIEKHTPKAKPAQAPLTEQKCSQKPVFPVSSRKAPKTLVYRSHTNECLKNFLTEECDFTVEEFNELNEADKSTTMLGIAKEVIGLISDKLQLIDTSSADRSRGDIKALKELPDIQTAITQLQAIIERAEEFKPECSQYLGIIVKSIMYLNQCSSTFKEAYRSKKTLLIVKYETLILSIISATAYLISAMIDFRSQTVTLKPGISVEKIAPIKTLEDFNKSVESGEFKVIINDTGILREHFKELSVEEMNSVCESTDIINLVTNGIRNLYANIDTAKLTTMLYKATGIVVLLLSVRDAVYSFSRMRTKFSDMAYAISNFANINISSPFKALSSFASKFVPDAENATDIATNEIKDNNKKLALEVRAAKAAPVFDQPAEKQPEVPAFGDPAPIPTQNNPDLFSF